MTAAGWLHRVADWYVGPSNGLVAGAASFLLHSTVLIGVALLVCRLLRKRGAAVRSAVLRAALAAALLCPVASVALRRAGASLAIVEVPRVTVAPMRDAVAAPIHTSPVRPASQAPYAEKAAATVAAPAVTGQGLGEDAPPAVVAATTSEVRAALVRTGGSLPAWVLPLTYMILAGVWIAGTGFLLARLAACNCLIALMRRRARPVGEELAQRCRAAARKVGTKAPPVLAAEDARSPFLTGVLRPAIVLPAGAVRRGCACSEEVFVHELGHLKRHDCLWNLLARVLCAVAFWQPLAWLLARKAEDLADEVCDDYVVRLVGKPAVYARELSALARRFLPSLSEASAGVGVIRFRSSLGRRVARILDGRRPIMLRISIVTALTVATLAVAATFGVGLLSFAEAGTAPAAEPEEPARQPPTAQEEQRALQEAYPPPTSPAGIAREAAREGRLDVVRAVLDQDPDIIKTEGTLLLLTASMANRAEVVELLLDVGADVNANVVKGGLSPLYAAAVRGHIDVVRLLLNRGAIVRPADPDIPPPLYGAVQGGHRNVVELLLASGADVDPEAAGGWNALYPAALAGHTEIVELLLARGADVNAANPGGDTALHAAAKLGSQAMVELLLANGADVNATDTRGRTPMHVAIPQGHVAMVEQLLAAGADIAARDERGATALHQAAALGRAEIARLLAARGADIHAADKQGRTSLHYTAISGHTKMAGFLLGEGIDVNARDQEGATAVDLAAARAAARLVELLLTHGAELRDGADKLVLWAARRGTQQMLELLEARGADLTATYEGGETALHHAAGRGKTEIVEFLLARGAELNATDDSGRTPLHSAARRRDATDVVELLIQRGADVNARTNGGTTALHHAVQGRSLETAELLIAAGADVNARSEGKWRRLWTPLHYAADTRNTQIAELLLQNGADLNARAADGTTPLRIAARAAMDRPRPFELPLGLPRMPGVVDDSKTMLEFLLARGAEHDIYTAVMAGELAMVEALLDEDPALARAADEHGSTPLHWAIRSGRTGAAVLLLERGADVNARGPAERTPLHAAAHAGEKDLVDLLLARGADPNAASGSGQTPLFGAVWSGSRQIVEALLAAGAHPNVKSEDGRTPLTHAFQRLDPEVVKLLREHGAEP